MPLSPPRRRKERTARRVGWGTDPFGWAWLCGCVLIVMMGCQPAVPEATPVAQIKAGDGAADPAPDAASDLAEVAPVGWPQESEAPAVVIDGPATGDEVLSPAVKLVGRATDDTAVVALTLQVGTNLPTPLAFDPDTGAFDADVPLAWGTQRLEVVAWDPSGNHGKATVLVTRAGAPTDKTPPSLQVIAPVAGFTVPGDSVWVIGQASDDTAVTDVKVQVGAGPEVLAETTDHYAHFVLQASFAAGGAQKVRVVATDTAGRKTAVVVLGGTTKVFDTTLPSLTITAPKPGLTTEADLLEVSGTAQDSSGVAAVDVRVGKGPYQSALTQDGFAHWSKQVALWPGDNLIRVRARDKTGLVRSVEVLVTNTTGATWAEPVAVSLTWKPPAWPSISFTVDRAGLGQLFSPEKAAEVLLMKLDVRKLIEATFNQIRGACGPGWKQPNNLSKSCPKSWGQPEINLWRLVTMTPANVNVTGTSIEGMKEMATTLSQWGLIDAFDEVLAAALGIGLYDLIVGQVAVAEAMVDLVIATHPNALPDGRIPISLHDGMSDLTSMGARFDAAGKHPGFLDKAKPPYAKVLLDSFSMMMTAVSNLAWHDGVQLRPNGPSAQKSYIALVRDKTGPTFDDVLEFEFLDPAKFQISGLAAKPTTDITLKVSEHPTWAKVGTSRYPLPKGNGAAWNMDPWLLEHTLAEAAWRHYKTHRVGCDYCKGASSGALLWEVPVIGLDEAELVVGRQGYRKGSSGAPENFATLNPNPAGWMRVWTLFGLGSPPQPQYVWDMILEVSQRRLLDGGVAQGEGNARFSLQNVDVGITAASMKAALTPSLQQQKAKLSALLMGKAAANDPLDFYLTRGADSELRLTFAHPGDPIAWAGATHTKPGFFADEQLTQKLSSTADGGSGDGLHEKLAVGDAPQTVYCADVSGTVYRVAVGTSTGDEVPLSIRRRLGGKGL